MTRVEAQIQSSPAVAFGRLLSSMFGEADAHSAQAKDGVDDKLAEQRDTIESHKGDAPKDAGAPPPSGIATAPHVAQPQSATNKGPAVAAHSQAGHAGSHITRPALVATINAVPTAKAPALQAALGDAATPNQLDAVLDAYNPKSAEGLASISRIKQMRGVADSFSGSLDLYVAKGNVVEHAIAGTANFFNLGKQTNAIWASNPYRHVAGGLGTLMTILSTIRNTVSVVGAMCTKIGMVLSLVGLLGMIFPPIGTAVEGIARVLNVVGLICDAVSFTLSGVLTGLNAVVLAQQIASGASAEEKAATADLLLDESNQTASGLSSIALSFGTGFMMGLQRASKGVASSVFRQLKTRLGKFSFGLGAGVQKVFSSIGNLFGGEGSAMTRLGGNWRATGAMGAMGRGANAAWHAPGRFLSWARTGTMARFGTSKFAQTLDTIGARSGAFASTMEGMTYKGLARQYGEKSGKAVMSAGENSAFGRQLSASSEEMESRFRVFKAEHKLQQAALDEKQNWKLFLAQRDKQRGIGVNPESTAFNENFAQKRFDKTLQAGRAKIGTDEIRVARLERTEEAWDTRMQRDRQMLDKDPQFRNRLLSNVHDSRVSSQALGKEFAADDKQRLALMAKESKVGLSADQKDELAQLDIKLTPLDEARAQNVYAEKRLKGVTSGGKHEIPQVDHWADVWSQTEQVRTMQGEFAETSTDAQLRKAGEANVGHHAEMVRYAPMTASSSRAVVGEHAFDSDKSWPTPMVTSASSQLSPPTAALPAPIFGAFTTIAVKQSTVGSSTRSMLLATLSKKPAAGSPRATGASNAGGSATAQAGAIGAAGAASSMPATGADMSASAQSGAVGAASEMAQTSSAPSSSNAEVLPYWPALRAALTSVTGDFNYMRTSGHAFLKAQIKARQTAVDSLASFGRYDEYAKARAKAAEQHKAETATTQANAAENATQSATASDHANTGENQQDQARNQTATNNAAQLPQPTATGFWSRLTLPIKRWATEKAAAIFGWIQEKVASLVLEGLCGVSFKDLKDYSEALRRSQNKSAATAAGAQQTSSEVQENSIKLSADASSQAQFAADSIGECDRNIGEAEQYLADIEAFESQVAVQKLEAEAFLQALQSELETARARRRDQDGLHAAPASNPTVGDPSVDYDSHAAVSSRYEPNYNEAPSPYDNFNDHDARQADIATVVAAAGYVRDSADAMSQQVLDRHDSYVSRISFDFAPYANSPLIGPTAANGVAHADQIVRLFGQQTSVVRAQMISQIMLAGSATDLPIQSSAIITAAEQLDADFSSVQLALDYSFEETYSAMTIIRPNITPTDYEASAIAGPAAPTTRSAANGR